MASLNCCYCAHPLNSATARCPSCNRSLLLQNRYQLVKVLGKGGFGIVFEVVDLPLERRCVVKAIPASSDAERQQIESEAEALSRHATQFPFVPNIYAAWSDTSCSYLVMEHIPGHGLDKLLMKPWPAEHAEEFLRTVLGHLAQLHAVGTIHRNLKPGNIARTPDGRYLLLDFGIAKQGVVAQVPGRPAALDYASPEQLHGEALDARSDLYSLAATTYHLLTGRSPARADVRMITDTPLPPPSQIVGGLPPALDLVLLRMLELDPGRRPPSAQVALQWLADPASASALPELEPFAAPPAAAPESAVAPTSPSSATDSSVPPSPAAAQPPAPQAAGVPQQQVPLPLIKPPSAAQRGARLPMSGAVIALIIVGVVGVFGLYLFASSSGTSQQRRPATSASDNPFQDEIATAEAREAQEQATQQALEAPTVQAEQTAKAQAAATATAEINAMIGSPEQAAASAKVDAARQWPVVVYDPFDNNKWEWPQSIQTSGTSGSNMGLSNGRYRWDVKSRSGIVFTASPLIERTGSFFLTATMRRLRGVESTGYGLAFRQVDAENYYVFLINDNQSYACFRNVNGRSVPLVDWTPSPAIKPNDMNRLTVLAEGSRFTLYINQLYVATVEDDRFKNGLNGIAAVLFADGEAAFEFDDFQLHSSPTP